jgi:hypothetical protein
LDNKDAIDRLSLLIIREKHFLAEAIQAFSANSLAALARQLNIDALTLALKALQSQ